MPVSGPDIVSVRQVNFRACLVNFFYFINLLNVRNRLSLLSSAAASAQVALLFGSLAHC